MRCFISALSLVNDGIAAMAELTSLSKKPRLLSALLGALNALTGVARRAERGSVFFGRGIQENPGKVPVDTALASKYPYRAKQTFCPPSYVEGGSSQIELRIQTLP